MEEFGWPLGFGLPNFGSNKIHSTGWLMNEYSNSSATTSSIKHRRSVSDTAFIDNASPPPAIAQTDERDEKEEQLVKNPEQLSDVLLEGSMNKIDISPKNTSPTISDGQDGDCVVVANQVLDDDISLDPSLDPKRARRIIANRQSAQRSRIRKLQYIAELEKNVSSLQMEVSTLTPQVSFLDHQRVLLNVDNGVMKQRIAALAQNVRLKDAHNEALRKEAESLRQLYQQQQQQFEIQYHQFDGFIGSNPQDHGSGSSSNSGVLITHKNTSALLSGSGGATEKLDDACYSHTTMPDFGGATTRATCAPLSLSLKF
ncbi:basic leucine zipper 6 [Selaginella moellendorffii]|nr:basic leucine zipper 6 [Selaginella moellendorffii]|eukprot:XP_002966948.2 basic leucine zipper 6 [Selaginella moellendorffii]